MTTFFQKDEPFITVKDVQRTLGTLLHDCLGTYTFKEGHTRKAIAVNKRDDNVNVVGLELVLKPAPTSINRLQVWGFFLVAHDDPAADALYYAMQKLNCVTRRGGFSRIINQNYELKQTLKE